MIDYLHSGVNIQEGYKAIEGYKKHAQRTTIPGLLSGIGSFSGLFSVPKDIKEPVMVSGTDGVGTKLDIAFRLKTYDTVGIDCVAMSVNDVLCTGAKPLFFLDYIACGKLDANVAQDLVKGVADGCIDSNCALLGGETAEMPGFYDVGKYDIAGFAVGIAEKKELITGQNIKSDDVLVGLSSVGVHSNGFSLVRKLVNDYNSPFGDTTIGEALLTPTRIYVRPVLDILKDFRPFVHAMSHITGGGFYENIPRMFTAINKTLAQEQKKQLICVIKNNSFPILPIFDELIRRGADKSKMFNTFNMGIGFVLCVAKQKAGDIIDAFNKNSLQYTHKKDNPFKAYKIGTVVQAKTAPKTQQDSVLFED